MRLYLGEIPVSIYLGKQIKKMKIIELRKPVYYVLKTSDEFILTDKDGQIWASMEVNNEPKLPENTTLSD